MTTTTTARAVTLPAAAVERLRDLLGELGAAEAATSVALAAVDVASETANHETAGARHREWERACLTEDGVRMRIVCELRPYLLDRRGLAAT